jgi:hypothetical protein
VRWVDPGAPWASQVGVRNGATRHEAALAARVALLYDDDKAGLRESQEFEVVVHPLSSHFDPGSGIAVDYDDRDLRAAPAGAATYVLPAAPIGTKTWWNEAKAALVDHLVRNRTLTILVNRELKLYSRPGESEAAFARRCDDAAQDRADAEAAKLRSTYEPRIKRARDAVDAAQDKVDELQTAQKSRRTEELVSGVGSILGGFLGGRRSTRSIATAIGGVTRNRGRSAQASQRLSTASNRVEDRVEALEDLEAELLEKLTDIDARWRTAGDAVEPMEVPLEKTDVRVEQLVLAWLPMG